MHPVADKENKRRRRAQQLSRKLGWAVTSGDVAQVRRLLHAGADPDATVVAYMGRVRPSLLCCASMYGYSEVVEVLLEAGADTEIGGEDGYKPLHYACAGGHAEVARLLLRGGAQHAALGVRALPDTSPLLLARLGASGRVGNTIVKLLEEWLAVEFVGKILCLRSGAPCSSAHVALTVFRRLPLQVFARVLRMLQLVSP